MEVAFRISLTLKIQMNFIMKRIGNSITNILLAKNKVSCFSNVNFNGLHQERGENDMDAVNSHSSNKCNKSEEGTTEGGNFYFHPSCSSETITSIQSCFTVINNFIGKPDELYLVTEIDPHLSRYPYELNHWDDAIHGYREIEKSKWSGPSSLILSKIHRTAFLDFNSKIIPQVHVLDLSSDGVIKPHIDSIKFCGSTIAALSLLSDAVMRLVHEQHEDQIVDILLPRHSLYIMKDESRYKYKHEILGKDVSYFGQKYIEKGRRMSVICRSPPP